MFPHNMESLLELVVGDVELLLLLRQLDLLQGAKLDGQGLDPGGVEGSTVLQVVGFNVWAPAWLQSTVFGHSHGTKRGLGFGG